MRAVRRLSVLACSLTIPALIAACGQDAAVPSMDVSAERLMASSSPSMAAAPAASDAVSTGRAASFAGAPGQGGSASAAAVVPSSMIIRNGSASVLVDSLELSIAAVQQLATRYGGYVGNTSLSAGDYQVRSATLEIKIPAARFDSAIVGLKPIGKVESVSSTAEDVGEEFVDVTARVANAKRLEDRLVALLATRTGKLEDVLAVERELSRVREEIERYEGRLRYLTSRVAISTLSVTVHERAPLVSATPGENVLLDAFRNAWRNLVRFVAGFIALLGIIVPSVALLALVIFAWRRFRRRAP
jgi:Domain of unknown function (DUF4349)